jgi:site-specific recombinase
LPARLILYVTDVCSTTATATVGIIIALLVRVTVQHTGARYPPTPLAAPTTTAAYELHFEILFLILLFSLIGGVTAATVTGGVAAAAITRI